MIKTNTIFIIGAGASAEADLPTGEGLMKSIRMYTKNAINPKNQDDLLRHSATTYAVREGVDPNEFITAFRHIHDAMPVSTSIDNFIHYHADKPIVVMAAKMTIALAIIEAERASKLRNTDNAWSVDLGLADGTWYIEFFRALMTGHKSEDISKLFENIEFVIFNYDRCVEHFFYQALRQYCGLSEVDASNLMGRLRIAHPYGSIGPLPWRDSQGLAFGQRPNQDQLITIAEQIRTFTEEVGDHVRIETLRQNIAKSDRIIFQGFAFHPLNMELLQPEKFVDRDEPVPRHPILVMATMKGISSDNQRLIMKDLEKFFLGTLYRVAPQGGSCVQLMREYSRMIQD